MRTLTFGLGCIFTVSEYFPIHDPAGYEFGKSVIESRLVANERLLDSIEALYVVRPNRWEWGCIAVTDRHLNF